MIGVTSAHRLAKLPSVITRAGLTCRASPACSDKPTSRAPRAAGIEIDRIEIDKHGKIVVFPRKGAEDNADAIGEKITDLDKWIADHARQT